MNTDRFEVRVHGVQQLETAATSTLAHVQQFAVASITETTTTLVVRADVERHVMCEDTIVEQAIAKEITHEVVEMVRRYVFELPLSDVTVVDGEKAVHDGPPGVAVTPAAEVYLVSIVREVEREMSRSADRRRRARRGGLIHTRRRRL